MANPAMMASSTPPIHRSLTAAWLRRHHACRGSRALAASAVPMSAACRPQSPVLAPVM